MLLYAQFCSQYQLWSNVFWITRLSIFFIEVFLSLSLSLSLPISPHVLYASHIKLFVSDIWFRSAVVFQFSYSSLYSKLFFMYLIHIYCIVGWTVTPVPYQCVSHPLLSYSELNNRNAFSQIAWTTTITSKYPNLRTNVRSNNSKTGKHTKLQLIWFHYKMNRFCYVSWNTFGIFSLIFIHRIIANLN